MAHEHKATVTWTRDGAEFSNSVYGRGHVWSFDGGITVPASASPSVVPLPLSREDAVDPEEAFVAAVSSCHMLTFLSLAAKKRFIVDAYEDRAVGIMTKNEKGKLFVSKITLDPTIAFSGDKRPTPEQIAELHHLSHQECFIANSVLTEIVVAGIPSH
ncbi:OsmC family protein [Microvirga pudoricolor]|uniref:OsmC family protein n=1 Tax=Microvirga pudoricolor TaxID=2778729 RepID=UPI001951AC6A|nr:OsmC family protein [Microvirga pudoricolor]MBM6592655.1 OsmC family protein [Microvirga pudoricolor]